MLLVISMHCYTQADYMPFTTTFMFLSNKLLPVLIPLCSSTSGDNCEMQQDACENSPCEFSNCTDLTPSEATAQGVQFTCGDCEPGYQKISNASDSSCQG